MGVVTLNIITGQEFKRHVAEWGNCEKCWIGRFAHKHVFSRGTLPCDVLFVGEGPGKTEDLKGEPFVGKSGQLLDGWIELSSLQMLPWTWAITNVIACRATERQGGANRPPSLEEINNCNPRLLEFVLHIAKPKMIVTLGKHAANTCPEWKGLPRLELMHPAWVLRKGGKNSAADMQQVLALRKFLHKNLRSSDDRQGFHKSGEVHRRKGA